MPCKEVRTTGDVSQEAPGHWIDPDLEPMYELKPKDCERIINRMVNLLVGTILWMYDIDRREAADALRHAAARLLADYDEDVCELVWVLTRP